MINLYFWICWIFWCDMDLWNYSMDFMIRNIWVLQIGTGDVMGTSWKPNSTAVVMDSGRKLNYGYLLKNAKTIWRHLLKTSLKMESWNYLIMLTNLVISCNICTHPQFQILLLGWIRPKWQGRDALLILRMALGWESSKRTSDASMEACRFRAISGIKIAAFVMLGQNRPRNEEALFYFPEHGVFSPISLGWEVLHHLWGLRLNPWKMGRPITGVPKGVPGPTSNKNKEC